MRFEELDNNPYFSSRLEIFVRDLFRQCNATFNDWLIIEPYSIGDAYHTLALMKAFREKWVKPGERIVYLCNQRCLALTKIFPFVDITAGGNMPPMEFHFEMMAEQNWPFGPGLPIIMAFDMHMRGKLLRLTQGGTPSMNFKRLFLHLSMDTPLSLPVISAQARANAERLAAEQGVQQNTSLIIINHGATHKSLPEEFWHPVIKAAREKGLSVFSDITTGQPVLPDTSALKVSLEDLIPFCEFAGKAAVLRSGLVDVIHTAKCRMVTVYPGHKYSRFVTTTPVADEELLLEAGGLLRNCTPEEKEKPVFVSKYPDLATAGAACANLLG